MKNATPSRICPICEGIHSKFLHAQKFCLPEGHPLANGYNVVACLKCGFVYADTCVTQQDYDIFYERYSKYEDSQTSTGAGDTAWDARRLRNVAELVDSRVGSKESRVLDIGCANGGLLAAFQQLGYKSLTGIDPSPVCARITREKYGIETHSGSIYSLPDMGKFDVVILSHVLEHLSDLRSAVQVASGLLTPGGLIYAEVPDATRYPEFLVAPFQDFNTEHINHFSPDSLVNLFAVAGLNPVEQGRKEIESAKDVPYPALYAFFENRKGSENIAIKLDEELLPKIEAYIAISTEAMASIDCKILNYLESHSRILVWGTGQLAIKLLAETCLGKADIVAFVDGNPSNQGKILHGTPVIAPEEVSRHPEPILIASTIHQVAIAARISEELRLPNQLLFLR